VYRDPHYDYDDQERHEDDPCLFDTPEGQAFEALQQEVHGDDEPVERWEPSEFDVIRNRELDEDQDAGEGMPEQDGVIDSAHAEDPDVAYDLATYGERGIQKPDEDDEDTDDPLWEDYCGTDPEARVPYERDPQDDDDADDREPYGTPLDDEDDEDADDLPCEREACCVDKYGALWTCLNDHTGCLYNDGQNGCTHEGDSPQPLVDGVVWGPPEDDMGREILKPGAPHEYYD